MNPFLYYTRNKRATCLFILIISLCIFTVITMITLESSVHYASRKVMLSPLSEFSFARWRNPGEDPDIDALNNFEYEYEILEVALWHVGVDTMLGSSLSLSVITQNISDLEQIFTKSGLEMVGGSFPREGYNEIIVHENIMVNQNLNIGDDFFSALTVSGYFSGNVQTSFGLFDFGVASDFLLLPRADNLHLLNQELDELNLNSEYWEVFSHSRSLAGFEESFSKMITVLYINLSLISLSISIALGALAYTMYHGRLSEFAMLNALGYTRGEIGKLIFAETIIITSISWIFGYLLSLVTLFMFDISFFRRLGQSILFFSTEAMALSVAIVVFIIICATVPSLRKLFKSDLVSTLERR